MAEITVYGAEWCPDCRRTKRALDAAGVAYAYRDLEAERGITTPSSGDRRITGGRVWASMAAFLLSRPI